MKSLCDQICKCRKFDQDWQRVLSGIKDRSLAIEDRAWNWILGAKGEFEERNKWEMKNGDGCEWESEGLDEDEQEDWAGEEG